MEGDGAAGSSRGNEEEVNHNSSNNNNNNGNNKDDDDRAAFVNVEEMGWRESMNGEEEEDGAAEYGASDVEMLKRAWRNEKAAPEVLPFQGLLVERIKEQILLMEDNVVAFGGELSEELMLSLYRMELDRTLFLLRAYLRTRLKKAVAD